MCSRPVVFSITLPLAAVQCAKDLPIEHRLMRMTKSLFNVVVDSNPSHNIIYHVGSYKTYVDSDIKALASITRLSSQEFDRLFHL